MFSVVQSFAFIKLYKLNVQICAAVVRCKDWAENEFKNSQKSKE